MTNFSKFLSDDQGAVTIDWVALTAGVLLLGIMVVYAIFNGGVAGLVGDINATLAGVTTDVDTGAAPDLNGVAVAGLGAPGPMVLSDGTSLPEGTTVVVKPGPIGSDTSTLAFLDSNSSPIVTIGVPSSFSTLDGATVSSSTTFTTLDNTILQQNDFFPPT